MENITNNYSDQIDEIMDWFDFDKVHKAMVATDWRWTGFDDVPSVEEIRADARKNLKEVIERHSEEGGYVYSGGLKASLKKYDEGDVLTLEFIVSDWDARTFDD